jgi:hypothetical protein
MRIGDLIAYAGRHYVVRGLDPMGVPERRADLEDVETGESIRVPIAEIAGDANFLLAVEDYVLRTRLVH